MVNLFMGKSKFSGLIADIDLDVERLSQLVAEMNTSLPKIENPPSAFEVRAIASIIHDFYTGIENIFEHIVLKMEGDLPSAAGWHVQLLKRVGASLKNLRPAVIDKEMEEKLVEYLSFRHLFRNIYGFELKWERCKPLACGMKQTFEQLKEKLKEFKSFLNSL